MGSVLQPWVEQLGIRHQGVLLAGVRGCDTAPKNDPSKNLVRCFRAEVLNCFCGDPKKAASFIEAVDDAELEKRMTAFLKDHDHYPTHYVGHLMLASEVLGYKKPHAAWRWFYFKLVESMHLKPESEHEMDLRLNAGEEEFGKAQNH